MIFMHTTTPCCSRCSSFYSKRVLQLGCSSLEFQIGTNLLGEGAIRLIQPSEALVSGITYPALVAGRRLLVAVDVR